ncbi:hypothetical protein [Desulfotomaculum sp. 1211_IL3151]|uniref:hypothetical protein n=1 Tax=Desulfotomaculum sp. 1211_IL3151 TaxID=3084055 RepID=UPI002FDB24BA
MIKAYLVGISTSYENEDIQILYRIYKDEERISEKKILKGYQKPSVVSHVALLTLLKELKKHIKDEIIIVINDAALNEQIRGTTTTKKAEVLKMANKVREELKKFNHSVTVKDVSGNHAELMKWHDELNFGF